MPSWNEKPELNPTKEFLGGRDIAAMTAEEVQTALTEYANSRLSQRPEAIKKREAKYGWPSYQAKNFKTQAARVPQERVM